MHNSRLSAGEIEVLLNLGRSSVYGHLSMLKDAGVIELHREQEAEFYSMSKDFIQENARLYDYIIKILSTESKCTDEVKKLEKYKKTGFTSI